MVVSTHIDQNEVICCSEDVTWQDLELCSIIAEVCRKPNNIKPWEWEKGKRLL